MTEKRATSEELKEAGIPMFYYPHLRGYKAFWINEKIKGFTRIVKWTAYDKKGLGNSTWYTYRCTCGSVAVKEISRPCECSSCENWNANHDSILTGLMCEDCGKTAKIRD